MWFLSVLSFSPDRFNPLSHTHPPCLPPFPPSLPSLALPPSLPLALSAFDQDSQVACHNWYPSVVQNGTDWKQTIPGNVNINAKECLSSATPSCTWMNDLTSTSAVAFVRAQAPRPEPFFLYLSTTTPHVGDLAGALNAWPTPHKYMSKFEAKEYSDWPEQQRQFAAAVWAQDEIVGAVLTELDTLNIANDTLVFFSGDNGPDSHAFGFFDDPGPVRP